jgi:hypothetical protein
MQGFTTLFTGVLGLLLFVLLLTLAVLWIALPFAVFSIKSKLDSMTDELRQTRKLSQQMVDHLRRLNNQTGTRDELSKE